MNAINPSTGLAYGGAPTATPQGTLASTPQPSPTPAPTPSPTVPSFTPSPAPVTQPVSTPPVQVSASASANMPKYTTGDLTSMQAAYSYLGQHAQSSADYNLLSQIQQQIGAEQSRQNGIITGAKNLINSGAGSVAINDYYSKLAPADQALVQGTLGNSIIAGYKPTNSNNTVTTVGGGVTTVAPIAAPTPTTASPAQNVAAPTTALQPGSSDSANVTALQNYLVANGYMTQQQMNTGPGTYGPATTAAVAALQKKLGVDNSTGVGYYGPKTQAAIAAAANPPGMTAIGNPVTAPTGVGTLPTLPTATAPDAITQFNTSLQSTIATQKAALDAALAAQTADYQSKIDALTSKNSDLQTLQDMGMAGEQSTVAKESADKQAALELEKQQFTDNYNASQSLVDEMSGLLDQGNALVSQMQNTTGLSSIMQPQISKTMTDIAARAGVIQAVLAARNNQIGLAQSQLSASLSAISSIANDQISYYQNIISYYNDQQKSNTAQINSLSSDQQVYVKAQIQELQDNLAQTQATATAISNAMVDPNTALLYAKAGVTLTDSPQQINSKLAVAGYAAELSNTANKMAAAGYSSTPIHGVTPVTTTDSAGVTKNWYKDTVAVSAGGTVGAGNGSGGGTVKPPTGAPINVSGTDISQGQQILNASKTAANAQGVAGDGKYADPSVYLKMYTVWLGAKGTAKGFQAAYPYTTYINPANTWLLGEMQKAEAAASGTGGDQTA